MSIKAVVSKKIIGLLSVASATIMLSLPTVAGSVEDGIAERIQPVGSVCIKGDDCAKNLTVAATGPKSGEEVYNASCLACHVSGAAGAPKFRNADDWAARLTTGLDALYASAISGKGAMPAKGLCMTCSDEELKAAVDHMIEGL